MLQAAFSLDVGVQEVIFVVGPLLTVGAVHVVDHAGGVLACALFGLVGTLELRVHRSLARLAPDAVGAAVHGSPLRHRRWSRVFVLALGSAVPVGALAIVAAAFAARHGDSAITGWALAANAGGALVAGLYGAVRPLAAADAGTRPSPAWRWPRVPAARAAAARAALAAGRRRGRLGAAGRARRWCSRRSTRSRPANLVTEANAWVVTAFTFGAAAAALLAGVVTDHLGARTAIAAIVIAAAAITLPPR